MEVARARNAPAIFQELPRAVSPRIQRCRAFGRSLPQEDAHRPNRTLCLRPRGFISAASTLPFSI
jgi:hypothetical protein